MTIITIQNGKKLSKTHFEKWEDLQSFVLEELMVKIYPLEKENINNALVEKVKETQKEFHKYPESFENI
jgi:hypothetical protein